MQPEWTPGRSHPSFTGNAYLRERQVLEQVFPPIVAARQADWSRRHRMLRAHKAGASIYDICEHEDLSPRTVKKLIAKSRREEGFLSPAEAWLTDTTERSIELRKLKNAA